MNSFKARRPRRDLSRPFVAIDFETAEDASDSACAVALVRVENFQITTRQCYLIRPPRNRFVFTYLHGISWERVSRELAFGQAWPKLVPLLEGVEFLAAHNAPFDRAVLHACCRSAGLPLPQLPFECTVQLARKTWGIYPTKLPHVCFRLGIPLKHHDPCSDAEACATIVIEAARRQLAIARPNIDCVP